jgi:hypothetical protein
MIAGLELGLDLVDDLLDGHRHAPEVAVLHAAVDIVHRLVLD